MTKSFSILGDAGITLKIIKCLFFSDPIEYLGHIIKPGKLEVDLANTASLREANPLTTKTEIRSFLGLCNVYRRFVENFTELAQPLNRLLQKGHPGKFGLDEEQMNSFKMVIERDTSPPILVLLMKDPKYSIYNDASNYEIGVNLFRTGADGTQAPIC